MQTVFRNPLAGPSVLGISSGASMGVAFVVLLSGSLGGVALSKLGFMGGNSPYHSSYCRFTFHYGTYCLRFPKSKGQCYFADYRCDDWLHSQCGDRCAEIFQCGGGYSCICHLGVGKFLPRVSGDQMTLFICIMVVLLPLSFLLVKTLNLLLLGDAYARNLGLNIKRARLLVITCSGVLVAIVTAYCGPIIFLGLAVPHLCRGMFRTSDHRILMPASLLAGASLALVCNLIARMPGFEGALPVNSVTALVGAPVVMSVLFNKRRNEMNE